MAEYERLTDNHDQQENTTYSVPFLRQGGPIQVTANVCYSATPHSGSADARSGVSNEYEEPNSS